MSSWSSGPFGLGPWGGEGGGSPPVLVRNFIALTSIPGTINLNWKRPLKYDTSMEIIIVRRKDAFPMELFNDDPLFAAQVDVSGFTDPPQVELFRGRTIRGSNGTGSLNTFTDLSSIFPISPSLAGRILRDSQSHNFRILSNTSTVLTLESGTPSDGQYVVLVDFSTTNDPEITGTSTAVGAGFLTDTSKMFVDNDLVDRILIDQAGTAFVIISNISSTVSVSGTPVSGDYTILQEFNDFTSPSQINKGQFSYIDNFLNKDEAIARIGTGLESEQFYYYTVFTHIAGANVAQSVFGLIDSLHSTQAAALSVIDREFHEILLKLWPNIFKQGDVTGDFEDVMKVFGFGLNENYSYVNTFDLINPDRMYYPILIPKAKQTGISIADDELGIDTLRRMVSDLITAWQKKGSKNGIVEFIRIITTWDVTNGTKDSSTIVDDQDLTNALRFYSDTLGIDNTRLFGLQVIYINDPFISYTYTTGSGVIQYSSFVDLSAITTDAIFEDGAGNVFDITAVNQGLNEITIATGQTIDTSDIGNIYKKVALPESGRFFNTLSGIIIPGFFEFKEFIVEVLNVALFTGESTDLQIVTDTTTMTDTTANFGGTNNLVGNFLLPKQGQINDIFEIIANTTTTITVLGVVKDIDPIGDYAVLSPLNSARFQRINTLMDSDYSPSFARMGLQFVNI